MSILIDIVNWVLVNWLMPILPSNLPGIPYDTYISILGYSKNFFIYIFSFLNNFFPISLFLGLIILILTAEILLFSFKIVNWFLNLIRGAGA